MADVNTDKSTPGFVFGQNMEDRVVKGEEDTGQEDVKDKEEVVSSSVGASAPSVIRPSAFKPQSGGVTLAPSKFQPSPNPWKSPAANNDNDAMKSNSISNNPFAEVTPHQGVSTASSDSEDERKDKPLVAPGHNFNAAKSYIGPSKLAAAPTPSPSKCLLRPSALDKQTSQLRQNTCSIDSSSSKKSSFKLEPAKIQSPFGLGKNSQSNKENQQSTQDSKVDSTESDPHRERSCEKSEHNSGSAEATSNEVESAVNSHSITSEGKDKNPFIFGEKLQDRVSVFGAKSSSGFVFGQNLSQRVTAAADSTESPNRPLEKEEQSQVVISESSVKSLEESAAAEQAKHAKTVIQEEVQVKTGEEDESNVFQLNAKLFAFDQPSQSWLERGRGTLRLNDMTTEDDTSFRSRLVMRTHGSLRVIMNTKVWAGQTIERASQKSVRLSAWDGEEGIKVFLIMANPKDMDQIFSAIDWRIQGCKADEQKRKDSEASDQVKSGEKLEKDTQKRRRDTETKEADTPTKKQKVDGEHRKVHLAEESNDSSTVDPETEASSESFTSSPTVKSTSSDN